jgi:hypothetical protein
MSKFRHTHNNNFGSTGFPIAPPEMLIFSENEERKPSTKQQ